jgi:hypothetical protein
MDTIQFLNVLVDAQIFARAQANGVQAVRVICLLDFSYELR